MTTTEEIGTVQLFITDNAYALCASHLEAWRRGGNTVGARVLEEDERCEGAEYHRVGCADCDDAVNA